MYYTGVDPRTMKKVYVPRDPHEKAMQRALMQFRNPALRPLVEEALAAAGRTDLIGYGPKCLIRPVSDRNPKPHTGRHPVRSHQAQPVPDSGRHSKPYSDPHPDRHPDERPDRRSNRKTDRHLDRRPNQNPDRHPDRNPDRHPDHGNRTDSHRMGRTERKTSVRQNSRKKAAGKGKSK